MPIIVAGATSRRLSNWSFTYRNPVQRVQPIGMVVQTNMAQTLTPSLAINRKPTIAVVSNAEASIVRLRLLQPKNDYVYLTPIEVSTGQTVSIGQAIETDAAFSFAKAKSKAVGQVVETNSALTLLRVKSKAIGQVSETDTASLMTVKFPGAIARVVEADAALTFGKAKARAILPATETSVSRPLTRAKRKAILQVSEADSARALSIAKVKSVLLVVEQDAALTLQRRKVKLISQAIENGLARPLSVRPVLGRVVELNFALQLNVNGGEPPVPDVIVAAEAFVIVRTSPTGDIITTSTTPPIVARS